MSDAFQVPPSAPVPVALPQIVWIGHHPTIYDPFGTRLRRCVICSVRDLFDSVGCDRVGMIVHLIDPADVHEAPNVFDGMAWAEPEAIAGAHRHWNDKGFRVVRKPDGPTGEFAHPRFRPCPRCNEEAMRAGTLGPVVLAAPAAPVRARGRAAR